MTTVGPRFDVVADLTQRPKPPTLIPREEQSTTPDPAMLALQVLVSVNILAIVAHLVSAVGDSRVVELVLTHSQLIRSASLGDLSLTDGGLGWVGEALVSAALFDLVLFGLLTLRYVNTRELKALLLLFTSVLLVLGGGSRLLVRQDAPEPGWISILVWLTVCAPLGLTGLTMLRASTKGSKETKRSALLTVLVIGGVVLAAVVPLMRRFGLWQERARQGSDAFLDELAAESEPWLVAAGVSIVALGVGVVLLRPPYRPRLGLMAGVAVVAAAAVMAFWVIPDQLDLATAQIADSRQTATTVPEVASAGPVPPCAIWSSSSSEVRATGSDCGTLMSTGSSGATSTERLPVPLDAVGPVLDPLTNARSTTFVAALYGSTIVLAERFGNDGPVIVTARRTNDFEIVWSQGCASGADAALHLSGSDSPDDPAANRGTQELFGLISYVAVECDGARTLYDPISGTAY